ncbi:MAG TPA: hypothetical protein VJC10_02045 [Patescibacteria group bacterium]|nr:hypothetical protein [Patescibacteria group bacterium]
MDALKRREIDIDGITVEQNGFVIKRSKMWEERITFTDVGAVVYFLKAIPWIVESFSVDNYLPYLGKLTVLLSIVLV